VQPLPLGAGLGGADERDRPRVRRPWRAFDEDQSVARALGSERTPEVFVFDGDRRLAYHGVIDDDREGDNIEHHYLREALDALLAGERPAVAETQPLGCTVKWRS
jgi:hypothetical protein